MDDKKVREHLKRIEALRKGEKIECPFCRRGKLKKKNNAVFLCDICGRGIVGRADILKEGGKEDGK